MQITISDFNPYEEDDYSETYDQLEMVIVTLLFFATTVNYMDRQVLSLTWKDFIAPEFH